MIIELLEDVSKITSKIALPLMKFIGAAPFIAAIVFFVINNG